MGGESSTTNVQHGVGPLGLKLADVLDNANDAIIVTDTNHRILGWNKRAEEMYGFSKEEVAGETITNTIIGSCQKARWAQVIESLNRGEPFSGEYWHVTKSGKKIPVHVSVRPIFDASGRRLGFLGIVADILDIKRKEERLRQQNRQLRAFKEVTCAICSPMPTKEVLLRAIQSVVESVSADAGVVVLLNGNRATFCPVARQGLSEPSLDELASADGEKGFTGHVIRSGKSVLIRDAWRVRKRDWLLPSTINEGFRSFISVPLRGKKGVLGALEVASRKPNYFREHHLQFLTMLGGQVVGAVENAMLREELGASLRSKTRLVREARHRLTPLDHHGVRKVDR